MELKSVGEVIATRTYIMIGEGTSEILIQMGKPQPYGDQSSFYCPYQIVGIGNENVNYSCGVDAVQAIKLAFDIIGHKLNYYQNEYSVKIRWLDKDNDDLGL